MNRFLLAASAAFLLAFAGELPMASAQPQVPGGGISRPTFSPYLNLLGGNGGRSPALNYLGIVRPQIQLNQQFGQLQQQLTNQNQAINQAIQASDESFLPPTGNISVFNSTGGYFNRIPGVSAGGGGSAGGFSRPLGAFGGAGGGGGGSAPGFARPSGGGASRGRR